MPDILTFYHEHYHLSDIRSVVANAFQTLGNEYQLDSPRYVTGVLDHIGQQLSEDLLVLIVDVLILLNDFFRKIGVGIHKGIETFLQNPLSRFGHDRQCDQFLQLGFLNQLARSLRNVDGDVPDALNVANNLQSGSNGPKVARHGLLQSEYLIAERIDLDLELIQRIVSADHFFAKTRPALAKCPHGVGNHLLGLMTHEQKLVFEKPK